MENQKKPVSSKKLIAIAVAAVVLVAALIAVYVGTRPGDEAADEQMPFATVQPEETEEPGEAPEVTDAPETEAPGAPEAEAADEPEAEIQVTDEPEAVDTVADAAEDEPVAAAAEGNPNDVMVTVNGSAITRADYNVYLTDIMDYYMQYASYFYQYGIDVTSDDMMPYYEEMALETAIEFKLISQMAVNLGLAPTEEEIAQLTADNAAQWAEAVDWYAQTYYGVTEESTEEEWANARLSAVALLESWGYTEESLLEGAIGNLEYEKVYAYVVQDVEVTDADIQAAYDAYVEEDRAMFEGDVGYYEFQTQYYGYGSYYTPEGYRGVTHILLEVDEDLLYAWQALSAQLEEQQEAAENADPEAAGDAESAVEPVTQEQVDAAKAAIIASVQPTIDEIYAKLEAGVPFADLVAEYGTDPGMTVEPTRTEGYPVHLDSIIWDPAFVAGAFSVDKVGDVSEPVVGMYGVHIIQYTRDIPAGPVELTEEMRTAISDELLADKESDFFTQTMDAWKEAADIAYSDEAMAIIATFEELE